MKEICGGGGDRLVLWDVTHVRLAADWTPPPATPAPSPNPNASAAYNDDPDLFATEAPCHVVGSRDDTDSDEGEKDGGDGYDFDAGHDRACDLRGGDEIGGNVYQDDGFSQQGPLLTRSLADEDPMGGSYEHLGCYLDSKEDRILGSRLVSLNLTTMECHTHCDAMGAAYMATQYGTECWCSNNGLLDFERHGDGVGKCDSYCGGDEMQTCGGVNAFDLYRMEWAPASDSPEYKGCYMDMKNDRVMGDMMQAETMTPVLCRKHCMGRGVATYATQRLLQTVVNFSQLAESNARTRRGASTQRATPRALIAAIVCRIWQDRTRIGPSVRQQPPRFSNITATEAWHDFRFRAEERKLLCPKPLRSLRILRRVVLRNNRSTFHGETALRLPFRRMRKALLCL
eukprot:jgi/Undpi1/3397/HiC_scaffold_15.g06770.m1